MNKTKTKPFLRSVLTASIVLVFAAGGVVVMNSYVEHEFREHSRLLSTERWIESYVQHNNRFPESWQDIASEIESPGSNNSTPTKLSDLTNSVQIDWNAGAAVLQPDGDTNVPLESPIIRLRSGSHGTWHGTDPNAILYRFLQNYRTRSVADWQSFQIQGGRRPGCWRPVTSQEG